MSILTGNWHSWYLEALIPNTDLDCWNSDPKIHFWANLNPKIQSCPFCLKNGASSILRILIPNLDLDFWNFDPKIHFWANLAIWGQKFKIAHFVWKLVDRVSQESDFKSRLRFLKFWPQNSFLGKFGPKNSKLSILSENWYTWYLKDADSYSNISFLNLKS